MVTVLFLAAATGMVSMSFFNPLPSFGADRKIPVYSVDTDAKKVAISFDAAWGNEHTEAILDILDQYNVKTTFFLVDFWAKDFPEDVKAIAARGHEVESHSATHPDMANLSPEKIREELNATAETIEGLTGKPPTLFRPPFGSYNNTLMETAEELGYHVIQWSVDSLDWKDISADEVVSRVTGNIQPGSIVLFHNNAETVEEYLPRILEDLQSQGYEIVPVGQLIYKSNYRVDHTGKQISQGNAFR
ncbi:MAG: polysaccharide deacetylase family protein [Firmicutes bacterium]|nr:polysaccharide deacetylase family protein [Bacillota bacterium]